MEVYDYKEKAIIESAFSLIKPWASATGGIGNDELFSMFLIRLFEKLKDYDIDRFMKEFLRGVDGS